MSNLSVAEKLQQAPRGALIAFINGLTETEAKNLRYEWRGFNARPNQIAPDGDWIIWLALAGRGFGKTRMGAEWVREQVFKHGKKRIGILNETHDDIVHVNLLGDSGLLAVCKPNEIKSVTQKPVKVVFSNGAVVYGCQAVRPDKLRGLQFDAVWCDEPAKWRYAREAWDMMMMGLRLGADPKVFVSTTPRPIELLKSIISGREGKCVVTRGATLDNKNNLSDRFIENIYQKYGDTRLGRQELSGEMLSDMPNALFRQNNFDENRLKFDESSPIMERILVAIDPAVTNNDESNEHGIIVVGLYNKVLYVLEDATISGSPIDWASRAVSMYRKWQADGIVIEVNQGGDMCRHVIRSVDDAVPVIEVRASRGKHVRAEPISSLYEQSRVRHCGLFNELENQLALFTTAGYEGDGSPDRADALIWGLSKLLPDVNLSHKIDFNYSFAGAIC